MNPGIPIVVWAALRRVAQKATDVFAPRPSAQQLDQWEQQAAALRQMKTQTTQERVQREAQLAEDRRKGLLLPPEEAEVLYQEGMTYWHRGNKLKAAELISRAARNGNENARVMANMHEIAY